jgi:hypothetical protein
MMVEPISGTFVLVVLALILAGMFVANFARARRQRRKNRWNHRH